jgi:hypothetical protein
VCGRRGWVVKRGGRPSVSRVKGRRRGPDRVLVGHGDTDVRSFAFVAGIGGWLRLQKRGLEGAAARCLCAMLCGVGAVCCVRACKREVRGAHLQTTRSPSHEGCNDVCGVQSLLAPLLASQRCRQDEDLALRGHCSEAALVRVRDVARSSSQIVTSSFLEETTRFEWTDFAKMSEQERPDKMCNRLS